jgi:hypothetical protein
VSSMPGKAIGPGQRHAFGVLVGVRLRAGETHPQLEHRLVTRAPAQSLHRRPEMTTHRVGVESRFNTQPRLRLPGDAVAPRREDGPMPDDEVIAEAAAEGFELQERPLGKSGYGAGIVVTISDGRASSKNARRSTGCATGSTVGASSRRQPHERERECGSSVLASPSFDGASSSSLRASASRG